MDKKWKKSIFQLLPQNRDFARFFLTILLNIRHQTRHQKSDIGHQTPVINQKFDVRHQTSYIRHKTSDIRHQTLDTEHQTSDIRHKTSEWDIMLVISYQTWCRLSDIRHQTLDIRHDVGYQTEDIRHLNIRHQRSDMTPEIAHHLLDIGGQISDIRNQK